MDLNNNNLQKIVVKFKEGKAKADLKDGTPYFLEVVDGTEFPSSDRRINIFDDGMKMYQYYYSRDGDKFNEDFEILCGETNINGGKRRRIRSSKKRKASKKARKSKKAKK